jgi:hypothetical protein
MFCGVFKANLPRPSKKTGRVSAFCEKNLAEPPPRIALPAVNRRRHGGRAPGGSPHICCRHPRRPVPVPSSGLLFVTAKGRHKRCGDGYCMLKLERLRLAQVSSNCWAFLHSLFYLQPRVGVFYRPFALRTDFRLTSSHC